jgi:hypothetical protein
MRLSEVLAYEVDKRWSRQEITLAASTADYPMGAVLSLDSESGAYVHYLETEGDTEAASMLVTPRKANSAAQKGVAVLRGAVLLASNLAFLEAVTDEEKKAAFAQLTALGLVVQE